MSPQVGAILLCSLLGSALGNRLRCYDCGGGPGSACSQAVTTCGEGERCGFVERQPQAGLAQIKLTGNLTLRRHQPACVALARCDQVETESLGGLTYTTRRDCCVGDLCNGAPARALSPACVWAAALSGLTWLLPGLWSG